MSSVGNIVLGACDINFNGVDLGHTEEGSDVTYTPIYKDVMVDKFGESIAEKFLLGEKLTAKVKLAEFTIANLRRAIPQAQFAGVANARITIGAGPGKSSLADAAQLVLHPISEGTRRHDVVIYKAIVTEEVVLPHKNDEDKVIEVTFEGMIDESRSDGNYLGLVGDSTA